VILAGQHLSKHQERPIAALSITHHPKFFKESLMIPQLIFGV